MSYMQPPKWDRGFGPGSSIGLPEGIRVGGEFRPGPVPLPRPIHQMPPRPDFSGINRVRNMMTDPMAMRQGTGMYGPLSRHTQSFEQTPVAVAPTGPRRPPTFGREPLPGYWTGPAQNPMPYDPSPMRPLPDIGRNPYEPEHQFTPY